MYFHRVRSNILGLVVAAAASGLQQITAKNVLYSWTVESTEDTLCEKNTVLKEKR
jgi:hypothetical protein